MEKTMENATLEKRVAELEKEVAELKSRAGGSWGIRTMRSAKNDWLDTLGGFKDDPIYDEAMRLGRAWRKRRTKC